MVLKMGVYIYIYMCMYVCVNVDACVVYYKNKYSYYYKSQRCLQTLEKKSKLGWFVLIFEQNLICYNLMNSGISYI